MPTRTTTPAQAARAPRERAPHLGPERRRPQVLDAALSLAVRDGLGAVTFGTLAHELGVTRTVVYACYPDRVALLGALLDREESMLTADILDALHRSGSAADPEQAFVDGFSALLTAAERRPDSWRLLLSGEPDLAVSERVAQARAVVSEHATAWIRPAMVAWWDTADLDRKLPVLIDLFMATCESGVRSLLDPANDWTAADLGPFLGSVVFRAFERA
jgi:AcrR family transcriptional regulator